MNSFEISKTPFILFQTDNHKNYDISSQVLKGIQEETVISKVFFHPRNIKILQDRLKKEIFERSNGRYLIEDQDDKDLIIVMRSKYIQNARHQPFDIKNQIVELNNLVIDDIIPGVISEIKMNEAYLERAFLPRQIIDHPENVSVTGRKTLPSVTRTFDPSYLNY